MEKIFKTAILGIAMTLSVNFAFGQNSTGLPGQNDYVNSLEQPWVCFQVANPNLTCSNCQNGWIYGEIWFYGENGECNHQVSCEPEHLLAGQTWYESFIFDWSWRPTNIKYIIKFAGDSYGEMILAIRSGYENLPSGGSGCVLNIYINDWFLFGNDTPPNGTE
jgi:hypothetical protein